MKKSLHPTSDCDCASSFEQYFLSNVNIRLRKVSFILLDVFLEYFDYGILRFPFRAIPLKMWGGGDRKKNSGGGGVRDLEIGDRGVRDPEIGGGGVRRDTCMWEGGGVQAIQMF